MSAENRTKVEIDPKFLVYVGFGLIALLVFWELRQTVISISVMLFIAFIISAGLRPTVDVLQSKSIPGLNRKVGRGLAMVIVYGLLLILFTVLGFIITSEFVTQTRNLIDAIPGIFDRIVEFIQHSAPFLLEFIPIDLLQQEIGTLSATLLESNFLNDLLTGENALLVVSETLGLFSSFAEILVTIVTVVIVSAYMIMSKQPVYEKPLTLLPDRNANSIRKVLAKIEERLGNWIGGQLVLMLTIGVITYLLLLIPGFFDPTYVLDDYALPIAIIAGLLEALPNVGPGITLVITSILAIGTSGIGAVIYVLISFTLLQNVEAVFIVPMVMKRAVGIDPILSILGILAGFQIGGVIGAILSIPLIGIVQIMVVEVADAYKRDHS